jgi:hypothetical protein
MERRWNNAILRYGVPFKSSKHPPWVEADQ